jgi:hypothetical protein
VDLLERRGGYRICEWDVREPEEAPPAAALVDSVPLPRARPAIDARDRPQLIAGAYEGLCCGLGPLLESITERIDGPPHTRESGLAYSQPAGDGRWMTSRRAYEPPQPVTDPTPNPASDPPPEMPGDQSHPYGGYDRGSSD